MIRSFGNRDTQALFFTGRSRRYGSIAAIARRKMQVLDNMARLDDLRHPAGNRLEALKGDRKGQHSIRVNDQYRICFVRRETEAHDVEIVDYH